MNAARNEVRRELLEPSLNATERRIAETNERIILDLMRGRDTSADEARVARDLTTLRRMGGGRHGATLRPREKSQR